MKDGFITLAQQTNAPQTPAQTKTTVQVPANGNAAAEEQQSPWGGFGSMIPMVIVMAVLIYFMWRGQKKEQKRRQEMIDCVKVGDKVIASKYAGTDVKVDGEEYTIVRQSDILAIVE